MKDRIKLIIETENISYSKFADHIGIQRSGISHIINGRNKPSLEVVQKILETFEYINTDWLLFGKGSMKNIENGETQGDLFSKNTDKSTDNKEDVKDVDNINLISEEIIDNSPDRNKLEPSTEANNPKKKVEKIVILYSDKSFVEYKPEQ